MMSSERGLRTACLRALCSLVGRTRRVRTRLAVSCRPSAPGRGGLRRGPVPTHSARGNDETGGDVACHPPRLTPSALLTFRLQSGMRNASDFTRGTSKGTPPLAPRHVSSFVDRHTVFPTVQDVLLLFPSRHTVQYFLLRRLRRTEQFTVINITPDGALK